MQENDSPTPIIPRRRTHPGGVSAILELWRYRDLLRSLVIRDLKIKYQRPFLGLLWTLLNPLLTMGILITVFSYVVRIPIKNYWAFLISGFFVWNFAQQCLFHATTVLQNHASLNRSVYFPREVLILGAALSKLVEFLLETALVILLLAVFYHHALPAALILIPLLVAALLLIILGLMFPLAVAAVFFHDVQHAVPIAMMSLFYLSPVFYPLEMIPASFQPFYFLNPIAGLLTLFHVVLYQGGWPSLAQTASTVAMALATGWIGYLIFNRYKDVCVEIA